jgi:hypothetical protein
VHSETHSTVPAIILHGHVNILSYWLSASQEIPLILWNLMIHYRIHKRLPAQTNPCPNIPFKRCILILPSLLCLVLPSGLLSSGLPHQTLNMLLPHTFIHYQVFYVLSVVSDRLCGLAVRVSGYRYRGLGFDSRRYQIF